MSTADLSSSGGASGDSSVPRKPQRAISPRVRILLVIVLTLFSLLLANGLYLSTITFSEWWTGLTYQNWFYQLMFLGHLVLGLLLVVPVIVFGFFHWKASHHRRNRRAVRIGYALMAIAIAVLVTGILLMRVGAFELRQQDLRRIVYWLHLIAPAAAIWLYWLHRLVGPRIKWHVGQRIAIATIACVGLLVIAQMQDPRKWNQTAPKEGEKYFQPSLARTATGNFIRPEALQNDEYCKKCHEGIYDDWFHSAHHFSSFNNPAYLYAIRETRKVVTERDGSVQASRWCAGCHDPVPFFTGAFDASDYDDVNHPTSQAGITCSVCHAISHVNSQRGNADYVIDEPVHYPFVYSDNPVLQKINEVLVKSKPAFHKAEMLKPFHKTEEFCSTCHKVHLPKEVTNYKEFLRGQNHYDSYLLSGVSGHGARSFYYPPKAAENCSSCHMPLQESNDFAAKFNGPDGKRTVHDHFFPGANTALPYWRADEKLVERARSLLVGSCRVDLFGVREDGVIEGKLTAPLRPEVPSLNAGKSYLLETVIRTLKVGHHFTQGTVDSNEVWLEVTATSGGKVIGISGGRDTFEKVDEWSHYVNNFVIDRHGNRIARRNAQDIFVALYDHQIPPGSGQTVHYRLDVPESIEAPIEVSLRLLYRKFDKGYLDFMNQALKPGDRGFAGSGSASETPNPLPITVVAEDQVVFPIVTATGTQVAAEKPSKPPVPETWQRWNDYGIGLFLAGGSQLKQASEAFAEVEKLGRYDGPLNLARVQRAEGDVNAATQSLARSSTMDPPPPPWTFAWLSGDLARMQGNFFEAEKNYRSVLYDQSPQRRDRGFDFSRDYIVRNEFGLTLMDLTELMAARGNPSRSREYLDEAKREFETVLSLDPENTTAHANLADIYERLGDQGKSAYHRDRNLQYKPDDNAADVARPVAREKYPAANFAAEQLVIYSLHRPEAPGLGAANGAASSSTERSPPQMDSSAASAPAAATQIQSSNENDVKKSSAISASPPASP